MIRKRAGQRSFSDAILFGAHIPDPKTLLDPVLRKLDEVLENDDVVDEVLEALRNRHSQSRRRGRPGTPAEVVLRLLVLKHVRQWSIEELEWEATGDLAYRAFCRIDSGRVLDAKTMIRINQAIDEATLQRVFERIVDEAKERRVTRGRRMRVDTTGVETNVRHPLDSGLCEDVARVACREMDTFRNVRRSVARRLCEIEQIGRRPTTREAKRFGRAPNMLAADRGFYSAKNISRATAMGVRHVVIPKTGHRSDAVREREHNRTFRRGRAWRAGGEVRISRLKRTFGMARCRYRSEAGVARCVFWAAISNNLIAIAKAGACRSRMGEECASAKGHPPRVIRVVGGRAWCRRQGGGGSGSRTRTSRFHLPTAPAKPSMMT